MLDAHHVQLLLWGPDRKTEPIQLHKDHPVTIL